MQILESRPFETLRLRATMHGRLPAGKAMLKWEEETFTLTETAPGQTELTAHSVAHQPTAWFALILLFGDACGEQLRTLKGVLEGKPSGTIFEAAGPRVDALHKAEKFCTCPPPVETTALWQPQ